MAMSEVESVLEFLRKYGLSEAESALMEDIVEKSDFRSLDFEKFLFPMVPPPPPLRIPATRRRLEVVDREDSSSRSSDEFVSLGSSISYLCSSEFTNPYGVRSAACANSEASSDRLSEFGTARDYHDFEMRNDLYWHDEETEDYDTPPRFDGSDSHGCPSEDKFVMSLGAENQSERQIGFQLVERTSYLGKPWPFEVPSMDSLDDVPVTDNYHLDDNVQPKGSGDKENYSCSDPLCVCCADNLFGYPADKNIKNLKVVHINEMWHEAAENNKITNSASEHKVNNNVNYSLGMNPTDGWDGEFSNKASSHIQVGNKGTQVHKGEDFEVGNNREVHEELPEPDVAAAEDEGVSDELLVPDPNEDEYEVFNLRIIHRKNRTGFEENKDLPIVLNSIIAGRYYITEYLGSAAFSKVIQAHDLHMGIDVCLKIIKNDKDFFDQSLDEIKLLKYVNKHDPGDEHHILRLYDYFYYQEHLFIVCELLRSNLYEFQKFNRESGGEPYFTLSRLQFITRQCLEALEYLHLLGIIHCDLKPENILIKSYRRCEIKVIDLGSSCFRTDNLCLYVQSRSYRAPEVILGLPYDEKIDLWSLGCILAELCSGEVLFPNNALVMILARMIGMLGPIDMEMLERGQETYKYFTKEYDLYHINEETDQIEYIIPEESALKHHIQVSDSAFLGFLRDLLEVNPERRPTAREALQHPWLSHNYS